MFRAETVVPLFVAIVPTMLLHAFVPPGFNRIDAYTVFTQGFKWLIPHYPPLYPLLVRGITDVFGLSDASIHIIILIQQLILVAGLVYFASAFNGTLRRALVVAALLWGASLGLFSHAIFSEGLAIPLLVWLLGAAVRVSISEQPTALRSILPFYGVLVLCILTRHNLAVFAAVLPMFFLLLAVLERRASRARVRQVSLHILAGVCSIMLANVLVTFIVYLNDGNNTRILGRAFAYQMQGLPWEQMSESERHALMQRLEMGSPDPTVKGAVRVMIEAPKPWRGTYGAVREYLEARGSQRDVDEVMNAASRVFLLTPNKFFYARVLETVDRYMRIPNNIPWFVGQVIDSIEVYRSGRVSGEFAELGLISSVDVSHYQRITKFVSPRVSYWSANCYLLGAIVLALLLIAWFRWPMRMPLGALSVVLIVCGGLCALVTATITLFHVRYGAPVILMFWGSLAVVIGSLGDRSLGRLTS